MTDLTGARCIGQGTLMASTDPLDHTEAAKLCGAGTSDPCPAIGACGGMARGLQRGPLDSRPVGTWAGVLYGADGRKDLTRHPREHGTEKGYYQHKNRGERACLDCCEGLRIATQERRSAQVNPTFRTPVRVESGIRRGPDRANGSDPLTTGSILETNGG